MEEAWINFCDKKYEDALETYLKLRPSCENQYVIHFRIGELYFILEQIEKALASFDKSDFLLNESGDHNDLNGCRIKMKLANIYWMLGNEYSEIALNEIREAESIFKKSRDLSTKKLKNTIRNNVCWYQLEQYQKSKDKKNYILLNKEYQKLIPLLDEKSITSNLYDTASWCCYIFYLKDRNKDWLDKALKYCHMMDERLNRATFMYASYNLHINHLKEIMDADTLEKLLQ